jgi:hypothetical protein
MVEGVVGEEVQSHKKISAPETESVQDEHQPSVVSSTDGAKILKEIDPAIEGYENPTEIQIILSRVADKNRENKKTGSLRLPVFY